MSEEKELIKLKWGETPWDKLNREELLREVWRLQLVCSAMDSILRMFSSQTEDSPFWGPEGRGGRALAMADQVGKFLEPYDGDNMYRVFFRYAEDLLFDRSKVAIGFGWGVCPICKTMQGRRGDGKPSVGRVCDEYRPDGCKGILRPLEWSDLNRPEQEK